MGDCNRGHVETPVKKPDDWAIPPIPKVSEKTARSSSGATHSSAQASFEFTCTSVEEAIFGDCSIIFATASKMLERLRSPHLIKRATCAEKKQHDRRRVSCERDATETTTCSFRGVVSATFTAICENNSSVIRDESCLLCGATTFANDRKWISGSTRSTRTSVRQLHPLDSVTPSVGKVKQRKQPFTRHTGNWAQKKWTNFGVFCTLQLVSGLAGWHDEPRPSNAKWCQEWKGTEWRDLVLADLVRPTLKGLILTCCEVADGTLFCVDTRADGRKMCENKDTLLVRMRESEHHIAQLCSSNVIGERLKSSSATVCPTDADSTYLVETASIFAETLGSDSMLVLSAWMTRCAVKIQDEERKLNSASESFGELSDPGQK